MKVFEVFPGHGMATADVAEGLRQGFTLNNCEVEHYNLHGRTRWFYEIMRAEQRIPEDERWNSALAQAAVEIPGKILHFDPDVIVIVNGQLVHGYLWKALQAMRRRMGIPVHLVLTESPYYDEEQAHLFPLVDQVWSNDKAAAEAIGAKYLPAAWVPEWHTPPDEPVSGPDALFIGTGWRERVAFFEQVDWSGLDVRMLGPEKAWRAVQGSPVARFLEFGVVSGCRVAPLYAGAGSTLNFHRTSKSYDEPGPGGSSLNPRCYQVPACGGLLLSDWRPEWDSIFGDCLPTFDGPKELSKLMRHYATNHGAREDAVMASMEAVRPHSYTARAAAILEEI